MALWSVWDIAKITDRFELDEQKVLFDGKPSALLKISKNKEDDALRIQRACHSVCRGGVQLHLMAWLCKWPMISLLYCGIVWPWWCVMAGKVLCWYSQPCGYSSAYVIPFGLQLGPTGSLSWRIVLNGQFRAVDQHNVTGRFVDGDRYYDGWRHCDP